MEEKEKTIQGEFTSFKRTDEYTSARRDDNAVYRKLLRNAAIVAVLVLGIWGIKTMTSVPENPAASVSASELSKEEDLGMLKFVNGGFSLPVDGEVVETFAESEKNVSIEGGEQARVNSMLSGTVVSTDADSVVINNDNGTRTTYKGLVPSVKAGDEVKSAEQIGQLEESTLTVETVSSIGYVDPLSAEDMAAFEE